MAYQNVGTPRFYVDILQWYTAIGIGSATKPAIGLNPSSLVDIDIPNGGNPEFYYNFNNATTVKWDYWGVLGHTNATDNYYINIDDSSFYMTNPGQEEIVNLATGGSGANFTFHYDGFSLIKMNTTQEQSFEELKIRVGTPIGCFTMGDIYEMPYSPDLKLNMSTKMDGVKNIKSKSGATLSNAMYTKPPDWGGMGAWQLWNDAPNYRTGRRTWDLSFSYLSDSDVFPDNASTSYHSGGEADDFETNILDGTDFFSVVWNKTLGSALPFIFQPDNTNNNPDQFCIAKFVGDSLKVTQSMNRKYKIKLKIEEAW